MRIYLIHGKQRLEWLWVFQPRFLSWNAGITADLNPPRIFDPQSKSVGGYGPPFADLDPLPNFPFKHRLYHI